MSATIPQITELLSGDAIRARVCELGRAISDDYRGMEVHLVGVLKGAVAFVVDLSRAIDVPVTMDFLGVSSYGDGSTSSGIVRITKDLDDSIEGKEVLIVEDIVDSGLTLRYLLEVLRARQPNSLRVCALLNKQTASKADVQLDYVGFEIPDAFVVGYGLDHAQRYRNLPFIGVLSL